MQNDDHSHNIVIILNYNDGLDTIKICKKFASYSIIDRVIVVDNASTDNSYELFQHHLCSNSKIAVLETDENLGYARGNNFGVKYIQKKYPKCKNLIFSNSDLAVEEDAICRLVKFSELGPKNLGIIAPVEESVARKKFAYTVNLPTFQQDICSMLLPLGLYKPKKLRGEIKQTLNENVCESEIITGALFLIRFSTFLSLGMFDERTFLFGEERILGYKNKIRNNKSFLIYSIQYSHTGSKIISTTFSILNRFRILYKSRRVFWQNFVKIDSARLLLYDFISIISIFEIRVLLVMKGCLYALRKH